MKPLEKTKEELAKEAELERRRLVRKNAEHSWFPKHHEAGVFRLGRPGNTLKMGIVGMPNVGKSTTFNALTNMNVPA